MIFFWAGGAAAIDPLSIQNSYGFLRFFIVFFLKAFFCLVFFWPKLKVVGE